MACCAARRWYSDQKKMPPVAAPKKTKSNIRAKSREWRGNTRMRRKGGEASEATTVGVNLFSFLSTLSPCLVVALSFRQLPIAINGEAVPVLFRSPGPGDCQTPDSI